MNAGFPAVRPRRLRRTPALRAAGRGDRAAARPTWCCRCSSRRASPSRSRSARCPASSSTPGSRLRKAAVEAAEAGVGGLILFGIPADKDGRGSAADDPDGHRSASRIARPGRRGRRRPGAHGRPVPGRVHRPRPLRRAHRRPATSTTTRPSSGTPRSRVAQAAAGAHVVAPSGMMDGQVGAIRTALDGAGYADVADARLRGRSTRRRFYGPFREAAECAPQFGDRATYQQDPPGSRRGAARGRARPRRGRGHGHGQARAALPGRRPPRSPTPSTCRWPRTRSAGSTRWSRRPRPTAGWTATGSIMETLTVDPPRRRRHRS